MFTLEQGENFLEVCMQYTFTTTLCHYITRWSHPPLLKYPLWKNLLHASPSDMPYTFHSLSPSGFLMDLSTNPCMTHWCRFALLALSFSLKVSPNSTGCGLYFMKASIYFFVLKREWSIRVLSWWDKWYKIRQFCYWRSLLIMYHRFTWLSTLWESFSFPVKIIYQDTLF